MSEVGRSFSFRWARGLLAALVTAVLGFAAVEWLSPERRVGTGTVAAEVSVRVVPRLAPSAEAIRRRVVTTENLREVAARLRNDSHSDSAAAVVDDAATFERWRRLLVVEILPSSDGQRRRIRFVAPAVGRPEEAAALVSTMAAQYSESLTAERWYGAIDQLRSAESAADATFDKLLDLLRDHRTARAAPQVSAVIAAPVVPAHLPTVDAAPLTASTNELERELFRLVRQRALLLESLQPAHPQVVALDARLNSLQLLGAGTHVRRMSGEEPLDLTLPGFDDAPAASSTPEPAKPRPTPAPPLPVIPAIPAPAVTSQSNPPPAAEVAPAIDAVVRRWQESRTAVKACLDELLAPAAAEFPVVSMGVSGLHLWEHRAFWRFLTGVLGLLVGVAFALPRRRATTIEPVASTSAADFVIPHKEPITATTSAVPTPVVAEPTVVAPAIATEVAVTSPVTDELIRTVEQAAAAGGGPVLGVLVRRREPATAVA